MKARHLVRLLFAAAVFVAGGCQSNPSCACPDPWPPVLVGIVPPSGFAGSPVQAISHFIVSAADGTIADFVEYRRGCPLNTPETLPCTFPISASPSNAWIDLEADALSGAAASERVEIRAKNHCGADVAYVVLDVESESDVRFLDTRYVSPCP